MTGEPQDAFDNDSTETPSHKPQEQHTSAKSSTTSHTPTPTRRTNQPKPGQLPPWKVVLHNDNVNSMGEVVDTILALTPLSQQAAIRRMLETHTRGRSMLLTTHRERAELYQVQFARRNLRVTIARV